MDKNLILEELGLARNESKIYLALLELGASTVTEISSKTKVNRANIYDCLNKLSEKGLVSYFVNNDTKLFEAANLELLLSILKHKELKLNSIMPELKLHNSMAPKKSEAHIFEGVVALRNTFNHLNNKCENRYAYGAPITASKILGEYFLERYHRERIQKKIHFKLIYNHDAKERMDYLNSQELTEARYLPKEYDSPVTTTICGDEVIFFHYSKTPVIIQIKNQDIAASYKRYFDILWEIAKK